MFLFYTWKKLIFWTDAIMTGAEYISPFYY